MVLSELADAMSPLGNTASAYTGRVCPVMGERVGCLDSIHLCSARMSDWRDEGVSGNHTELDVTSFGNGVLILSVCVNVRDNDGCNNVMDVCVCVCVR